MLLNTGQTQENVLCQTTRSMLITVESKSVVDTLLCPKYIVFDLCSHISVQGKWLVLNFCSFGGFTGLSRVILDVKIILGGGGGGGGGAGAPPSSPAPMPLHAQTRTHKHMWCL